MSSTSWIPSTYTTGYTNLGSLSPTSFPSDCLQSLWDFQTTPLQGDRFSYQTQGCAVSTCCPSGRFYTDSWAWMTSYFSPGVCPSQYRSCSPPPATAPTVLSSQPGETIVFCCPTNYACPYTIPTSGDPYFLFCQSLMTLTTTSVVVMDNIFDQSTVSTRSFTLPAFYDGQYQLVYPIQVRMGASSVSLTSSTGSSQAGSITPTNTSARPSLNSTNATTASSSSMSTGAKAGIGAGAAVGSLLLIAFASYLLLRHRRQQKREGISQPDSREMGSIQEVQGKDGIHEVHGKGLRPRPTELSSEEAFRGELDGTTRSTTVHELG